MSKAEERALEKYPIEMYKELGWRCVDKNTYKRQYFIEGYHQAEKDLKLSWEDIPEIFRISEQLKTSWWFRDNEQTKQIGKQPFWEEVLKRFKAQKGEKI